VIDNSARTDRAQSTLTATFPAFKAVLANAPGGLPDLHIGVISSNMGAGGNVIPGCASDDGQLQHQARIDGCTPPAGAFIADEVDALGARVQNYSGTIEDTFRCIATLGTGGCGFEQHLASLERALDPTNLANAGFLRPDAHLAVIILADEDDCSASDPTTLFSDPGTSALGPRESFRCTEFGITCNEGSPSHSSARSYTGCRPRTDSPYVVDPQRYVELLKGLKCDPSKVFVSGILGNPEPVVTRLSGTSARLEPSCSNVATGTADPTVRLSWLLGQLPGSVSSSICSDGFSAGLQQIAEKLVAAMAR
jgi:hypothetical protein